MLLIGFAALARGADRDADAARRDRQPGPTAPGRPSGPAGAALAVIAAASVFNYSLPGLLWIGAVGVVVLVARWFLVRPRPELPDDWLAQARPIPARADRRRRGRDRRRVEPDRRLQPPLGAQPGPLRLRPRQPRAGALAARGARDLAGRRVRRHPGVGGRSGRRLLPRRPDRPRRPRPRARSGSAASATGRCRRCSSRWPASTSSRRLQQPLHRRQGARDPRPGGDGRSRCAGRSPARGPALALGDRPGRSAPPAPASSSSATRRSAPTRTPSQLESFRSVVDDEPVLFLGRDDFIGWELRGSGEITGIVTNFYDVEDARPRFKKGEGGGEKFDVDAVFPATLDSFRYILATTGGPASGVPPRFREVDADPRLRPLREHRPDRQAPDARRGHRARRRARLQRPRSATGRDRQGHRADLERSSR